MSVNLEALRKVAHLARLSLTSDEEVQMQQDLSQILDWMAQLDVLNTDEVEPMMHMTQTSNVFREDVPHTSLEREKALSQAPKQDGNYFIVPKVVE